MARREYLTAEERTRFDTPPQLSSQQRLILIEMPPWADAYLTSLQTATNKVGFALQLGYFRVVSRFFVADRYPAIDVVYVTEWLGVDPNLIDLSEYRHSGSVYRHRQEILQQVGYQAFGENHQAALALEAGRLAHLQIKPALLLDNLAAYLQERHVEIPTYNTLRVLLTDALSAYETHLEALIETHLQPADRLLLDALLQKQGLDEDTPLTTFRYELTHLKRISQSMQPKAIASRVSLFVRLKTMFGQLAPVISRLELSDDTIRYYAQYVLDNRSTLMAERLYERYLRLLAFVTHQYLLVGDALILTLQKAVATTVNSCEQQLKEQYYQSRYVTAQLVHQVSRRSETHIAVLSSIERIVDQTEIADGQKVEQIKALLQLKKLTEASLLQDQQRLAELRMINLPVHEREDFYLALEKASLRLQIRVAGIVQELVFDPHTSHPHLLTAIHHFQARRGEITAAGNLSLAHLDMNEQQRVITDAGKLRVSLYKVLLFRQIRDQLRDGTLNVLSCYDYRAFEEYMLPRNQWLTHREEWLERSNLTQYSRPAPTLIALNEELNALFGSTNKGMTTNAQVYFDAAGDWHMHRYRAVEPDGLSPSRLLYPTNRVISLREVLIQVDQLTHFLDAFTHKGFVAKPTRPAQRLLLAAVIGYGENIGIRKMALISKNITAATLETVATQYFSPEMTLKANDCILSKSNVLPLTDLFRRQAEFIHTGSDGQKYDVSVPSLRASASFKYFGNGEGKSVYSHLDEAGQLIHSTVFNAADRESVYLLDAILYNEVITPDAHATDSHGFSEPNFAITGLIDIELRPRFKTLHTQQLYSIDAPSLYRAEGYKLVPEGRIDYEHLVSQWDDILRLVVTVKLGYAKASTLFRRLNSYARQHPLYRALKDLGRLYKTRFILRYIAQPSLREATEGMLSKVEHANNFSSALTLGNNGAFTWQTHDEQLIAEGCKRLIMNAINYYNLLLMSDKLHRCTTESEKEELLATILTSSTHTWHHINLQGEYDFSDDIPAVIPFNVEALMRLSLERKAKR